MTFRKFSSVEEWLVYITCSRMCISDLGHVIAFHLWHYIVIHKELIVAEFSCHLCNHVFYNCVHRSLFGLYLDSDKFTPDCFFKINFSLILPFFSVGPPENGLFRYLTNTLFLSCISLISLLCAACHTDFILNSLTMYVVICGEGCQLWILTLCSFLHHAFSSSIRCSMCRLLLLHIQVFVCLCNSCIQQAICMS